MQNLKQIQYYIFHGKWCSKQSCKKHTFIKVLKRPMSGTDAFLFAF